MRGGAGFLGHGIVPCSKARKERSSGAGLARLVLDRGALIVALGLSLDEPRVGSVDGPIEAASDGQGVALTSLESKSRLVWRVRDGSLYGSGGVGQDGTLWKRKKPWGFTNPMKDSAPTVMQPATPPAGSLITKLAGSGRA